MKRIARFGLVGLGLLVALFIFIGDPGDIQSPERTSLGEEIRREYQEYFRKNPKVSDAVGEVKESDEFWRFLEQLERDDITYVSESQMHQAANMARAVWLDKNQGVPWKLEDYSESELAILFDADGEGYAEMYIFGITPFQLELEQHYSFYQLPLQKYAGKERQRDLFNDLVDKYRSGRLLDRPVI